MNRTQRIKRICQLQRLCENGAVASMKNARQKLSGARQLHAELEKHHNDYWVRLLEKEQKGLNSLLWRGQRQFIRALENAIEQQTAQVKMDHREFDLSETEWRQKHAETLASEAFLQRVLQRELRREEKRESSAIDDLVASRHGGGSR